MLLNMHIIIVVAKINNHDYWITAVRVLIVLKALELFF